MKEEAATDASLRQFLLGRVEDEERQRIESLFITDSVMRDRVLAAEQKLMDDYLEDSLSTADRESFLSLYGDTAAQRRKLRIAKSIQEWAANQPDTMSVAHGVFDFRVGSFTCAVAAEADTRNSYCRDDCPCDCACACVGK